MVVWTHPAADPARTALCMVAALAIAGRAAAVSPAPQVWPGATWEQRPPEQVGLAAPKLGELARLVGGSGCVVRHGYMAFTWGDASRPDDVASAVKPLISSLLLMAIQERRLASVDARVSASDARLKTLNSGKDAAITWRHLASQTSGYGLAEAPGRAWAYNDCALALYYDTLIDRVFKEPGDTVLATRLGAPLGFQDHYTLDAFGRDDRHGRLAISPRDFARFGLLWLRGGRWRDRQLLRPSLVRLALGSPVPPGLPRTSGREAPMLPGQRTLGGGRDQTATGPGYYSFNWWLNGTDSLGRRLFAEAPSDTFVASGHGGEDMLWVIPSLDMVVCWIGSRVDDQDASPGDPGTRANLAARLIRDAAAAPPAQPARSRTRLGIRGTRFSLNGRPTFLYGISYYGALGASDDTWKRDLDEMQRLHLNWIRVWATWESFGHDVSAVQGDGAPREPYLDRLRSLVADCDRRGMVVDVTLSRGPSQLATLEAHRRAVETLATTLRPWRNWYLDLANERDVRDARYVSPEQVRALRDAVKTFDAERLVTASRGGHDMTEEEVRQDVEYAGLDFVAPHRPRDAGSPAQTLTKTRQLLDWMRAFGRERPILYQEPFRRGYGDWQPAAADYVLDLQGALDGGAAGWCLHNGDQRGGPDSEPRRSFDLSRRSLFDQLDADERDALRRIARLVSR